MSTQNNEPAKQACLWTEDVDGLYETQCGYAFEFTLHAIMKPKVGDNDA